MTTTSTGRQAEDAAASYLKRLGYKIITQNWRTRWCEVDIIASKKNVIWFVEVKYRGKESWGSGLDYITPKKLEQMRFAAEFWVSSNDWAGDYSLGAIEVSGPNYQVTNFLTEL